MSLHIFVGGAAYAAHPLHQLRERLSQAGEGVVLEHAANVYLVRAHTALTSAELADLEQLLEARPVDTLTEWPCVVLPRIGTVSPWSSQATDITQLCGLRSVLRVERGRGLQLSGDWQQAAASRKLLHDALTETMLTADTQWESVLTPPPARPLVSFAGAELRQNLLDAQQKLGLSLSTPEVDWLEQQFAEQGHVPTDAELMMFAQVNSEHCRHKIFNASWTRDGQAFDASLFDMIRETYKATPGGILSAYSDNAAVLEGAGEVTRFGPAANGQYQPYTDTAAIAIKVETHNHPTAIAPDPGAATGAGGEIRDEAATGRGGKPKAGLCGFSVGDLCLPEAAQPWENNAETPPRMASPLDIMLDGPLGAARYNNEFGRPNLTGYFRTLDREVDGRRWGYAKPIMIAGGLGNLRPEHAQKQCLRPGDLVIVLGGPGLLIGLGGGAASSVHAGASSESLDFASVQRANPELERRCQEVIDACWRAADANPIRSIHDVGAGGLSNAIPELLDDSELGGDIDLDAIPVADPSLSPMEIWCNESQERYVLGIAPEARERFAALCARERCPFAVVGVATENRHLRVAGQAGVAVDLPMGTLLGKLPRMQRSAQSGMLPSTQTPRPEFDLKQSIERVLRLPAVASKKFLITIGDRSVGGMTLRDQMVGPWQVPVADYALTAAGYAGTAAEAMAMGERSPVAMRHPAASARLAVVESVTNILGSGVAQLEDIRLSCNWMAAAGEDDQNSALLAAVEAAGRELCPALGLAVPVGKDSLSMQTRWTQADGSQGQITAPVSLVVSSFAPVADAGAARNPQLRNHPGSQLLVVRFAAQRRLGASALEQVWQADLGACADVDDALVARETLQALIQVREQALAWHDIGDGGALVSLLEMSFASRLGLDVAIPADACALAELFSEEPGIVIQVDPAHAAEVESSLSAAGADITPLATLRADQNICISQAEQELYSTDRASLEKIWAELSQAMQARRDDPECAAQEYALIDEDEGLYAELSFDLPQVYTGQRRPRVAILREQGVNGQVEMAWMFQQAGFAPVDVHMSDILDGRVDLAGFVGLAACGGFSYGDVLGAGRGWAATILHHAPTRSMFADFFARPHTFALGVCNGCQMLSQLREIIPGTDHWPRFSHNAGGRFEARLSMVEITPSPSIMLGDMVGSRLPVVLAHGEGRAEFASEQQLSQAAEQVAVRYVNRAGEATEHFPLNPNGSPQGITGLCSADGRVTIMMPHPERMTRVGNFSWHPPEWEGGESPWLQMFLSARAWVDNH
nr:phosphoribosylformylglycinamidine synthase [Oceanococcus sp. HetDA_MAG_MS8]